MASPTTQSICCLGWLLSIIHHAFRWCDGECIMLIHGIMNNWYFFTRRRSVHWLLRQHWDHNWYWTFNVYTTSGLWFSCSYNTLKFMLIILLPKLLYHIFNFWLLYLHFTAWVGNLLSNKKFKQKDSVFQFSRKVKFFNHLLSNWRKIPFPLFFSKETCKWWPSFLEESMSDCTPFCFWLFIIILPFNPIHHVQQYITNKKMFRHT